MDSLEKSITKVNEKKKGNAPLTGGLMNYLAIIKGQMIF